MRRKFSICCLSILAQEGHTCELQGYLYCMTRFKSALPTARRIKPSSTFSATAQHEAEGRGCSQAGFWRVLLRNQRCAPSCLVLPWEAQWDTAGRTLHPSTTQTWGCKFPSKCLFRQNWRAQRPWAPCLAQEDCSLPGAGAPSLALYHPAPTQAMRTELLGHCPAWHRNIKY